MIVKKIKADRVKSKNAHVGALTNYIAKLGDRHRNEEVLYLAGRGFICDDFHGRQAEMMALATETVRSANPVSHWVISWQEGEHATTDQVEEAVTLFLAEMGLLEHQVLYAVHQSENRHLHLVVNRVHPISMRVIQPNKGFDIEAAHRVIARIEHIQGWKREQQGRYCVLPDGELGREHYGVSIPRPDQRRCDMEHRTGERSAERIAIETAAPLIQAARSWSQLHQALFAQGMRYQKTGSGAVVWVGDVAVKASKVDRKASLLQLQKRLGIFKSAPTEFQTVPKRSPVAIQPTVIGWDTYIQSRRAHFSGRNAAQLALSKRHDRDRKLLGEEQRLRREEFFASDWKGRGELLNAFRSVLAAQQAAAKAALKDRHKSDRALLRQQYGAFADFESWLRQQGFIDQADAWRYRGSAFLILSGETSVPAVVRDIRFFDAKIHNGAVHYYRRDGAKDCAAAFVDSGRKIQVQDADDTDSILAAMQLASQKWRCFEVIGSDAYKRLCAKLAAEHGFEISNPELQEQIEQQRQNSKMNRIWVVA